jgi:hypothetical protein
MSNDEYQQQQFWNKNTTWSVQQEKKAITQIQKDLDTWFVSTSKCSTADKLKQEKNGKVI